MYRNKVNFVNYVNLRCTRSSSRKSRQCALQNPAAYFPVFCTKFTMCIFFFFLFSVHLSPTVPPCMPSPPPQRLANRASARPILSRRLQRSQRVDWPAHGKSLAVTSARPGGASHQLSFLQARRKNSLQQLVGPEAQRINKKPARRCRPRGATTAHLRRGPVAAEATLCLCWTAGHSIT